MQRVACVDNTDVDMIGEVWYREFYVLILILMWMADADTDNVDITGKATGY